ncbi:hypothetical protein SAMN06265338_1257 [Rhodoblastus acidophilus]|uniref:Uncharacterized protein n=1 Tax=Rhodoblastus acidophilus TaxID=1074 RepID=A0A212SCF0_RHOAC|nr:hypothetical protein SAMN06265338_1257 [Rhodoblastus acidophilus]
MTTFRVEECGNGVTRFFSISSSPMGCRPGSKYPFELNIGITSSKSMWSCVERILSPRVRLKPASASFGYSVLATTRAVRAVRRADHLSRTSAKRARGNRPYATLDASPRAAGRKSGPGQMKRLLSVRMIQERSSSKPRRRFVAAGISTAWSGSAGGVCVIGSTVTRCSPFSSVRASKTAQGRSFTPSSCPRKNSLSHRYE